jgi:hypothetical protein
MCVERTILSQGSFYAANRAAINMGGLHADKEASIEPRIARQHRLVTLIVI